MNSSRKPRGIPPTPNGIQKLNEAKDNLKDANGKPLTYESIAEKAEISIKTVRRFLVDGKGVDRYSVTKIAEALNLDINEIVDPKDLKPPTPTTTPTEINWREICTKVLETQQLRRQATAQQYELNIYVPLGLMERPKTPNPRKNPTGEDSQPQKEPELQIVQTYKDDAFFLKVIAENRTEKGKHIAIIGEPGAGKTTLLGELAERLAKNSPDFPICIRLADLRDSTIADYLLNNWLSKALHFIDFEAENVTPEIRKSLKQLFATGKVWLLLDGVDEMAASSPIEALARIREQLIDWVGKARVVLTCRLNVWDAGNINALTNFDTYKTLEFEPDDVDEFIRQWFEEASQDEKRRNSGNETFWREQGKRLTTQLKEPGKERIKELVRNPLRLSMLCQSWCVPEQDLPETKAALYEQFTTYFFEWKQEEFQKKQRVLTEEDKTQIEQALAKLALAAMESVNRFRIEKKFAIEQMKKEWFNLADELGWLVLVDRDTRTKKPVYAFFHPTFQEYFAACAIEDWHFFLNHQIPPVSDCSYRIFERQWREVILLWLGRGEIEGKQKEEFIDALVNFEDGCGGFYEYRAYFLAAAAIAEFQDYSQIDKVVEQIVRWAFGYFDTEEQIYMVFLDVIMNAAREALQQTQRPKAIDALVQLLKSDQLDDYHRMRVAESLGNIGQGNQKAIDALVQLLSSPHLNDDTRRQVPESLGNIGQGNQKAIDALVQLLKSDQLNDDNRRLVAESLGKIGQDNQKAIDALVKMLSFSQLDDYTRWRFAESLGNIDPGNQKAIDALVQQLDSSQLDNDTRRQVAKSLGNIDPGNQKAIDALVQLLGSPQISNYTRWEVAESLGMIGQGNQKAIDALVQLLSSRQLSDYTRRLVAESLEKIGQGNQKAMIDALIQLLSSRRLSDFTRWLVANSLIKIDPGNQKAIDTLVKLLGSPQLDDHASRQVVESLGNIDPGNQKAIDALVQLLGSPQLDDFTRWLVANSLRKIDPSNQKAIDTLVKLLGSPQLDDHASRQVVESLGNIDPGNQKAIDALVKLLGSPKTDDFTCKQLAESLGKIDPGNQKAINTLVQMLGSPQLDDHTRSQVAKSLKKIPTDKHFAVITTLKANFKDSQQIDKHCYELICEYAQNLPYLNFYQAWHLEKSINNIIFLIHGKFLIDFPETDREKVVEDSCELWQNLLVEEINCKNPEMAGHLQIAFQSNDERLLQQFPELNQYIEEAAVKIFERLRREPEAETLNIANLPQVLAEAINNQPELCSKVKLICIDTHQFIDPENPAPEIYDLMLNQKCPEWQNGYPETMQKLKLYWNYLRRNSENPIFFICYDSTALTATPTGFSDTFLTALSKFEGAICVVWETGEIGLQTFSPSQPNLIADIVGWMREKMMENL
ncbi:MAG: HEAT repeat domain-containing protein [Phormidium sp.]